MILFIIYLQTCCLTILLFRLKNVYIYTYAMHMSVVARTGDQPTIAPRATTGVAPHWRQSLPSPGPGGTKRNSNGLGFEQQKLYIMWGPPVMLVGL